MGELINSNQCFKNLIFETAKISKKCFLKKHKNGNNQKLLPFLYYFFIFKKVIPSVA